MVKDVVEAQGTGPFVSAVDALARQHAAEMMHMLMLLKVVTSSKQRVQIVNGGDGFGERPQCPGHRHRQPRKNLNCVCRSAVHWQSILNR